MILPSRRSPAHVGFFVHGCGFSGPEGPYLPSLIGPAVEGIADLVDRVTVVAHDPPPSARGQDEVADYLMKPDRANIDVLSLGAQGSWRDYVARRQHVRRIIRDASREWDVAMFRLPNRRIETLFTGNECPRVVSIVLGYAPGVARAVPRGPRKALQIANTLRTEITLKKVLKASKVVLFNSKDAADRYRGEVPKPILEPWSMRRANFVHVAADRFNTDSPNIVICGRLEKTKGVLEALEVFARIRKSTFPKAHLHVIGDGDAGSEMERRVSEQGLLGSCTFHGWVPAGPDLFSLLREMDLMLHLSYAEGFPQVIWEALAHSVLVVCTPVGGIAHGLTDERDVLFVPVGTVDEPAHAVGRLAADAHLRSSLLRNGFDRARASSVEEVCGALVQEIEMAWPELRRVE